MENCKKKAFEFWVLKYELLVISLNLSNLNVLRTPALRCFLKESHILHKSRSPPTIRLRLHSIFIDKKEGVRGSTVYDFPCSLGALQVTWFMCGCVFSYILNLQAAF